MIHHLVNGIFEVDEKGFEALALEVFRFQYQNQETYRSYCEGLKITPVDVHSVANIPFLPIEFFKTHKILVKGKSEVCLFESSGTTGSLRSRHFIADIEMYERSFITSFQRFYGNVGEYAVLALLPSYLERSNSSLVYMAERLIKLSGCSESGFFLNDYDKLLRSIQAIKQQGRKIVLIGVSFALLDFADYTSVKRVSFEDFPGLIIMETGGMKGRRKELTREELHAHLRNAFHVNCIHSEYGMTELLSQAYAICNGRFQAPPWMKLLIRDPYDPFQVVDNRHATGAVNLIDLANLYSCSFIATSDLGKLYEGGSFEILGRMDQSEMRGCNLMVD